MIKLRFIQIKKKEIEIIPCVPGQIMYCTDTRETYYDNEDDMRINITNDTLYFKNESEREDFSNPLVNKLVVVLSNEKLYQYDGTEWKQLTSFDELERITSTLREFIVSTPTKDGKLLAPVTTTEAVYTSDGSRILSAIDDSKRVHMTKSNAYYVQARKENQRLFEIPFPIEDYDLYNNHMVIVLKGKVVKPELYTVDGNHLIFSNTIKIALNEKVLFLFFYNVLLDMNKSVVMDTCNYLDGSVTTEKISKSVRINADNIVQNVERIFFTPEEREKLSKIEDEATHFIHPATHPASIIVTDPQRRFVTDEDIVNWNAKANASDVYTKQETDQRIETVIGSAPEALDTLKEIADALGNDENFAATVTTELGKKATKEELQQLAEVVDGMTPLNDYIRNGLYATPSVVQKLDCTNYNINLADPQFKEYIDGMMVNIKIEESNLRGPAKLQINDLPVKNIITQEGYELVPEELTVHSIYSLRFNGSNGNFILLGKGGVKVLDTTQQSHVVGDKDKIIRGELLDINDNVATKTVPKTKTISYHETIQEDYLSEGKIRVLSVANEDKFILMWIENKILKAQIIQLRDGFIDATVAAVNRPIIINSNCSDFEASKVGDRYIITYATESNVVNMSPMFIDSRNQLRVGSAQIVDEDELVINIKVIGINATDAIISWEYGIKTKALLVRLNSDNGVDIVFTRSNLDYHLDSHIVVNSKQILFAYSETNKITAWVMAVTSSDFSATDKIELVANRNVEFTNPTFTFLGNNQVISMWTNKDQTELYRQFIEIDYKGGIIFQEPKTYMNDVYKIKSNIYPTQMSLGHDFYVSASPYYNEIPALTEEGKQCLKVCVTQINKEKDLYRTVDIHTSMLCIDARNIVFTSLPNDKFIIAFNAKKNEKDKSHIFFSIVETRKTPEAVAISNGEQNSIINVLKW